MIVLVPAYQPDGRLVALVERLAARGLEVLVVDDGSGPAYDEVFRAARGAGANLVGHATNLGKGRALRTGFAWVLAERSGCDVVCADCDGQHTPEDVLAVAARVAAVGHTVLGVRRFTGPVPLRSRIGNDVTRLAFRLATGRVVADTQTGLRGYPAALLPGLLAVPGDRFEYELALLVDAAARGLPIDEVPIETVYLDANASSHFRPVRDSVRVLAPLLRFTGSSLLAFVVDTAALLALQAWTGRLLLAVVGARLVSGAVNFAANRLVVFPHRDATLGNAARGYLTLALVLLAAGYGTLSALTGFGVPLLAAKVGTDLTLFYAGYRLQDRSVFAAGPPRAAAPSRPFAATH
jgi:putative flippase GtrA